jgi:hypothetical protein
VSYLPASDPPYSFYRIEFGRICWQENKYQPFPIRFEEVFEISRPVPPGIVQNKIEFSLSRLKEIMDKVAEGLGIESGSFLGKKTACFQVEGSE